MRCPIRPGKVTCAGIVAIMLVLPNSIWKGPDAKGARSAASTVETRRGAVKKTSNSVRLRVELRKVAR